MCTFWVRSLGLRWGAVIGGYALAEWRYGGGWSWWAWGGAWRGCRLGYLSFLITFVFKLNLELASDHNIRGSVRDFGRFIHSSSLSGPRSSCTI